MDNIFVFKTQFIEKLKYDIRKSNKIDIYFKKEFNFSTDDVFSNPNLIISNLPVLLSPENGNNHSLENAISLFEAFKNLNRTQASDVRFWTYLSHVIYWDYMKIRYPIQNQPLDKQGGYIISHWFMDSLNASNLTRYHGIASLWWGAYRTYDETREDPYELTKELFSMLDYSTHLTIGTQGRNNNFIHAILDFVVMNKDLFLMYKQKKVRYIMTTSNRMGGYKVFAGLSTDQIIEELSKYKEIIEKIKD